MIMDIHFMMDEGKWKSKMLVMSNLCMNGGLGHDYVLMGVQTLLLSEMKNETDPSLGAPITEKSLFC